MAGHENPSYEEKSCEQFESGFFEETSTELSICRLETQRDILKEMLESGDHGILELLNASPVVNDASFLRGSEYDPLTHFEHPPVIGILGLKYIEEEERYHENFVDGYGEAYRDFLFTQDTKLASANGFFLDYNGRKGLMTAAHVGPSFYRGLDTNRPNYELDGNTDALFFDFDSDLRSHLSEGLLNSVPSLTSPIIFQGSGNPVEGNIVSTISFDQGGSFHDSIPNLRMKSGAAILITPEIEREMLNLWDNEGRTERASEQGRYVGKYIYRISRNEWRNGGGTSGSPVFINNNWAGIHLASTHIGGVYFGIFSPTSMIEETVLSDLN